MRVNYDVDILNISQNKIQVNLRYMYKGQVYVKPVLFKLHLASLHLLVMLNVQQTSLKYLKI